MTTPGLSNLLRAYEILLTRAEESIDILGLVENGRTDLINTTAVEHMRVDARFARQALKDFRALNTKFYSEYACPILDETR